MNFIKKTLSKVKGLFSKPVNKVVQTAGNVSLTESLRSADIRKKISVTIGLIVIYRILAAVPLPGIDISIFNEVFGDNPLNNFFTLITGGRLDNPSVVAIGLGAYINASIIIQLLTTVIPKLEELSKEGERGRQTINQYTRFLTIPLTVVQAFVIFTILRNVSGSSVELSGLIDGISTFEIVTMIASLTAGSIILMWLGELISEYGIGNGISIIISVGILSALPSMIGQDFGFITNDIELLLTGNFNVLWNDNFILMYMVIIGFFFLTMGIVYITEGIRKIPIQYARRVVGSQAMQNSYLPFKINQAGVMPVIFASALLTFPQIIGQMLVNWASPDTFLYNLGNSISTSFLGQGANQTTEQIWYYQGFLFLLIVTFTFFYTFVTFKPSETAENLKKSGGFIPGLRPGKATQEFITFVLIRLTVVGAIFLGIVALIPSLIRLTPQGASLTILSGIGGTSLLIIVGVSLDTIRQVKAMTVTRGYEQYK